MSSDTSKSNAEADAQAEHAPDRPPTPEEAAKAEELTLDPDVTEHYEEMNKIGANVKGEGAVD